MSFNNGLLFTYKNVLARVKICKDLLTFVIFCNSSVVIVIVGSFY